MMKSAILVALAAAVGFVVFGPNDDVVARGSFEQGGPVRVEGHVEKFTGFDRTDVFFPSVDGQRCHGWLFVPEQAGDTKPGIVVMASGLGAQIDFGMEQYAQTFAREGFAALLFDYRTFGSSEGAPRNWINPWRHLDDWRSAIAYVNETPQIKSRVDTSQLYLWGSSLAGGHVLVIASEYKDQIAGVVSQIPHLDGRENRKRNMMSPPVGRGVPGALRIMRAALQDFVQADLMGQPPLYIPIVGETGSVALMPMSKEGLVKYYNKQPARKDEKGGGWQNMAPARVALQIGFYSPIDFVPGITAPTLFITASEDDLCPPELIRQAASKIGQVVEVPTDHFGIYAGEHFEASALAAARHFKKSQESHLKH